VDADRYFLAGSGMNGDVALRLITGMAYMEDTGAHVVRWAEDGKHTYNVLVSRDLMLGKARAQWPRPPSCRQDGCRRS